MKKIISWSQLLLVGIVLITSCSYPIDYTTLPNTVSYLTVYAEISNQQGPYHVVLTTSSDKVDFTGSVLPVLKAKVYLTDQNNTQIDFNEGSRGDYYTSSDFRGKAGSTYILHIETANGKVYASDPETMRTTVPSIDSVYYQNGQLLVNFQDSTAPNEYYEWNWKHYERAAFCASCVQGHYNAGDNRCVKDYTLPSTTVFKYPCLTNCWDFYNSQNLEILSDKLYNGQFIKGQATPPPPIKYTFDQAYFQVEQRAISESYYNYLRILKKQTENTGTLFDVPTLTKFNYNIHGITDPNEKILGIFAAYTSTKKIIYLNLPGITKIDDLRDATIDITVSAPCEEGTTRTRTAPDGWRN